MKKKLWALKVVGVPSLGNFGTPTWESQDKMPLDVALVERHGVYYKGEGGGFPKSGPW